MIIKKCKNYHDIKCSNGMGELFDFVDKLEKDFGLFMKDCVCFFLLEKDRFEDGNIGCVGCVGCGCEWWNDYIFGIMEGSIIEFHFFDMDDGIGHNGIRFGFFNFENRD